MTSAEPFQKHMMRIEHSEDSSLKWIGQRRTAKPTQPSPLTSVSSSAAPSVTGEGHVLPLGSAEPLAQ